MARRGWWAFFRRFLSASRPSHNFNSGGNGDDSGRPTAMTQDTTPSSFSFPPLLQQYRHTSWKLLTGSIYTAEPHNQASFLFNLHLM